MFTSSYRGPTSYIVPYRNSKAMHFDELPLEIVQYIFSFCCRSVKFRIPQPHSDQSGTTQVTLSLVCSRWRKIALNTGALWGDVVVIYDAGRERAQGPAASFQFVQNWLSRAGMMPISLSISVYEAWKSQITAISQTILSSFHITNLYLESFHCPLLVPTNNSSRLERLDLSLHEPSRTTRVFPRLPEMPSLTELHLCLYPDHFVDLTSIYSIPWHQLRVLAFSENHWPSQMLFNILPRCKSLIECTLWVTLKYGQPEQDVVLPDLESFVLEVNSEGSTDTIFRSLTLPNLKSLDIKSWYTRIPLNVRAIIMMAQRSGFNKHLTNFSLCMTEQPVDVGLLLGGMPALKSLMLHGPLMFLPGTFNDLSSGTIGPRLEDIYFGVMSDEEITLLLETVGQRHEKAKTVSDIRPFATVTSHCTSESDIEFHSKRAEQCGKAFNAYVVVVKDRLVPTEILLTGTIMDSDESDSDFSLGSTTDEESYLDEELGSNPGLVFVSDEEELYSDEESHSLGESESPAESYLSEDSSSVEESHWESDPDASLHSDSGGGSGEEADYGADVQ